MGSPMHMHDWWMLEIFSCFFGILFHLYDCGRGFITMMGPVDFGFDTGTNRSRKEHGGMPKTKVSNHLYFVPWKLKGRSILWILSAMTLGVNGEVTYSLVSSGSCDSVSGRSVITSLRNCAGAVSGLGLDRRISSDPATSLIKRAPGCGWQGSDRRVFYNPDGVDPCSSYYKCICKNVPVQIDVCSWSDVSSANGIGNVIGEGVYSVPAPGCKMKKQINIRVDVTIEGVSGTFRELQSNRVDNQDATASWEHQHFFLQSPGKLILNYLKLTWGQTVDLNNGGFITMVSGTLVTNWVHFDGSKTTGVHARSGGCIYVNNGKVTIKESTFEGFRASKGGAIYVQQTSTPMTIESTTLKNNVATVRFISTVVFINH